MSMTDSLVSGLTGTLAIFLNPDYIFAMLQEMYISFPMKCLKPW
jgi:hypothetical protein